MADKLTRLRVQMANQKPPLNYYVIPNQNAHGSKPHPECDRRLKWLSGYSGASGVAVVSQSTAHLFVAPQDYDLASQELSSEPWFVLSPVEPGSSYEQFWASWLTIRCDGNAVVGFDPRLLSHEQAESLNSLLSFKGSRVSLPKRNLVDLVWDDKPERSGEASDICPPRQVFNPLVRLERVRDWITSQSGHAAALIISPSSIAFLLYLTGTRMFSSYLFVEPDKCVLFHDFHTDDGLDQHFETMGVEQRRYSDVYIFLRERQNIRGKTLIPNDTSHAIMRLLTPEGCTVAPVFAEHLRMLEVGFEKSVLGWRDWCHLLYQAEPQLTSEVKRELSQNATFFERAQEASALTLRASLSGNRPRSPAEGNEDNSLPNAIHVMIISWLQDILYSTDACQHIYQLREKEAEGYMEALQSVLDWVRDVDKVRKLFPSVSEGDMRKLRRRATRLLTKLVRESNTFPPSLFIEGASRDGRDPCAGGNFANIFFGHYEGKAVALKDLRIFLTSEVSNRRRIQHLFCREAVLWRQFNHPSILPFLGMWSDPSEPNHYPFIVLPWMVNGNARDFTRKPEVTGPMVDSLLFDVARGLEYLHDLDVTHRDLCGKNILVDQDNRALLCDFGLTSLFTDPTSILYAASSSGHIEGTTRWMAPEVFTDAGLPISSPKFPSDIYSFGIVGWELYSGRTPYPELPTDPQVMFHVLSDRRPDFPAEKPLGRDMPLDLWNLLETCWVRDPTARPKAKDLVESMSAIVG
ncbi:hypothetical protein JAAARDRAFT_381202 [Jaapia argillacea MUCL 33604]|uniref:Protein kinase domain-containing protein n=1 Tax=Jaapia argillacea MUCL 33604 TaxID=933084 RepID=A0A067QBJ0_9AGAM|nr:hypothetical protein JAAARDRAFT_381202 [Jaapia argillacea MUCL 33604]